MKPLDFLKAQMESDMAGWRVEFDRLCAQLVAVDDAMPADLALRHQVIEAERQHQLTALTALLQRQRTQDALMQSTADGLCYADLVLYPRIHQVFRG